MKAGRIFDSWAILAYAYNEPAADDVENLLVESTRLQNAWISSINLGEVWYSLARRKSRDIAEQQLAILAQIGLERVDVDWPMVLQAADYKSRHRISYADAFAAALAKQRNAELVTGDQEFRPLESEIRIHWV
ncbi:MAG TPA: type II toxin-antitoxin system VapC family toxin [Bryobacteraceae bacterium]|nr:type II toxin-antitoxin system VapC family toxin [Bryobacteraceae bacterium]